MVLKVHAQAFSIEAANVRHEHEWKVWQDVQLPEGKILIPGVIAHATNLVEHPELVAQRLAQYASVVGWENIVAGADCGFATAVDYVRVLPRIAWAKLRSLTEGARLASSWLRAGPASSAG